MEELSRQYLIELGTPTKNTCVSIYLPTHRSGHEINEKQDLLLFKNLLKETEGKLEAYGMEQQETNPYLQPAYELLNDLPFWYSRDKGLAVLIDQSGIKTLSLPFQVESNCRVGNAFNILPLVNFIQLNKKFLLLNLTKKSNAFFEGDLYGLRKQEVEGLPWGIDDVIHFEEKSERKLFRAGGTAVGSAASYHGHTTGLADDREYTAAYLKEVDQTLWQERLKNEHIPLLLAGSELLVGQYRQISRYPYLVKDDYLRINVDENNIPVLWKEAVDCLKSYFHAEKEQALENIGIAAAEGLDSYDTGEIVRAAHYGQINDLFVSKDAQLFGRFDEENGSYIPAEADEQKDLLQTVVYQTIAQGGNVYLLEKEEMPGKSEFAASLRFVQ